MYIGQKGLEGQMAQGATLDTPVCLDANPLVPFRFHITGGTVPLNACHTCAFATSLLLRPSSGQPSPGGTQQPPGQVPHFPPSCYVRSM